MLSMRRIVTIFLVEINIIWLGMELFEEFPDNDAGGDGNIEGVLGTILGNLETTIAHIYHLLLNTLYLITQDDCQLLVLE